MLLPAKKTNLPDDFLSGRFAALEMEIVSGGFAPGADSAFNY